MRVGTLHREVTAEFDGKRYIMRVHNVAWAGHGDEPGRYVWEVYVYNATYDTELSLSLGHGGSVDECFSRGLDGLRDVIESAA